jgi:hypothetical protein
MKSVGFSIVNVVKTIDATGGKAKGNESHHAGPHIAPFGGMTTKEQGCEYETVLQPLVRAQQKEDRAIHVSY